MKAKSMKAAAVRNIGKGAKEEMLPSRYARAQLTGGDAFQRSMNNYAKKTPTGNLRTPGIFAMGRFG